MLYILILCKVAENILENFRMIAINYLIKIINERIFRSV